MARNIKEIGKKFESLNERGRLAEQELSVCQERLSVAKDEVEAAKTRLAAAEETDENGKAKGNVIQARTQLMTAQTQMVSCQRALLAAQRNVGQIAQEKKAHANVIQGYEKEIRSDYQNSMKLGKMAYGEKSKLLNQSLTEEVNLLEDMRAALLQDVGENAQAEYVSAYEGGYGNAAWRSVSPDFVEALRQARKTSASTAVPASAAVSASAAVPAASASVPAPDYDPPKMLRLSDDQKWRNGQNYISNMLDGYREELKQHGIEEGAALEQIMAEERVRMERELSKDIEGEQNDLYEEADYEALADRVRAISAEHPKEYAMSAEERAQIREKIRSGEFTEENVRQVGARIWQRYEKVISDRADSGSKIALLRSKERELALAAKNVETREAYEELERKGRELVRQENRYYRRHSSPEVMRDILKGIRPLGPKDENSRQRYSSRTEGRGAQSSVEAIENVRRCLPTDWVEGGNRRPLEVRHVFWRGQYFHEGENDFIDLSGTKQHMRSCAFHEMGHRVEQIYPEVRELERQFYERRTQGEELRWMGFGYSPKEKTRRDHFAHPYMGKDYGGAGYEILSMGLESLLCGTRNIYKDKDYCEFLLGVLAVV